MEVKMGDTIYIKGFKNENPEFYCLKHMKDLIGFPTRVFLIRNGENIINTIRLYNIQKTSCRPCDAIPINCKNICDVDRQSVNCSLNNECGVGTCYKAVPLPPSEYDNRLSESRDFASFR